MPVSKYKVELTQHPNAAGLIWDMPAFASTLALKVKRALALLKADEGLLDREVAEAVSLNVATVARVRRQFVEEGLEAAINDRPRSGRERKLSGRQEAHLVVFERAAMRPKGTLTGRVPVLASRVKWRLQFAGSISLNTVATLVLKKTN